MALIHEKLCAINKSITFIEKDRKNAQQGYNFRGIDDMYNYLHDLLAANDVFIRPEILDSKREERQTKSGGVMIYTILRVKFYFQTVDGSSEYTIVEGEASDSGDKSTNKSQSAALKYSLMQMFTIPTSGDNDADNHSPEFKAKNVISSEELKRIQYEWQTQHQSTIEAIVSYLKKISVNTEKVSGQVALLILENCKTDFEKIEFYQKLKDCNTAEKVETLKKQIQEKYGITA